MRCPVCRAAVANGPHCRRCRADLTLLFALEAQRQGALRDAYRALADADWRRLLGHAERAHILRQDEDTRRLLALGYLLCRDFASAWQFYSARPRPAEGQKPQELPDQAL
jgi:hypothetical protein